jgi:hypothetical protein
VIAFGHVHWGLLVVLGAWLLATGPAPAEALMSTTQPTVEQWGLFEVALDGPRDGNPFTDVDLTARFSCGGASLDVGGFYDGDGVYRIRFMPPSQGDWQYVTRSNAQSLSDRTGGLHVAAVSGGNHGPVVAHGTYHFAYADGTRFVPIGTTCYSWTQQSDALEEQTLATLAGSAFNKVRMCVLPVRVAPRGWPYARDGAGTFDPARFDPGFFRHFEQRVGQLGQQGVQADVILFHPYDKGELRWFNDVDDAADERYIRYVVARLAAYRNVWWSLANEYGQVKHKTDADWDRFFQCVQRADPYDHLRSIHNAQVFYDANKPWVTHASIQNGLAVADFGRASLYRDVVRKPVVYDEICYEGDIARRWGRLSGEEMTQRFWMATIAGTYAGHGETFRSPAGNSWTSSGGVLMGTSPARLAFLGRVLASAPGDIEPIDQFYDTNVGGVAGEFYLVYFGAQTPGQWAFRIPRDAPHKLALVAGTRYRVDVIDTWNMTVTPVEEPFTLAPAAGLGNDSLDVQHRSVPLPGRPYMALRIRRVGPPAHPPTTAHDEPADD